MASAAYLAEHLAEVPAIVIPTIIGRHDGSGRPGLFDSVIQAAWSFCLALRARGLGTTWVTAALQDEARGQGDPRHPRAPDRDRAAAGGVDQGHRLPARPTPPGPGDHVLRPLRHTFRSRARRRAALRRRPGRGRRGRHRRPAGRRVAARHRPRRADPVLRPSSLGAEWAGDERGVGAVFDGRNQHPAIGEWTICRASSTPTTSLASFGWRTSDPDNPGARWRFDLEPAGGRHPAAVHVRDGPGPSGTTTAIDANPDKEAASCAAASTRCSANMQRTVDGIKQLAEGAR